MKVNWIKLSQETTKYMLNDENIDLLTGGRNNAIREYYRLKKRFQRITVVLLFICIIIVVFKVSVF